MQYKPSDDNHKRRCFEIDRICVIGARPQFNERAFCDEVVTDFGGLYDSHFARLVNLDTCSLSLVTGKQVFQFLGVQGRQYFCFIIYP